MATVRSASRLGAALLPALSLGATLLPALSLGTLLLALAIPARTDEPPLADDALAAGQLLVARRSVTGPFGETVILLFDHGDHGAQGLVLNRPMELPLAHLLPQVEALSGRRDRVYAGGPVGPDTLRLLVRADEAPPDAAPVLQGLYLSGSLETLGTLLGERSTWRAYAGYAGWAPGQLEGEIDQGVWYVAPGDAGHVFSEAPLEIWRQLIRVHEGVRVERLPGTRRVRS